MLFGAALFVLDLCNPGYKENMGYIGRERYRLIVLSEILSSRFANEKHHLRKLKCYFLFICMKKLMSLTINNGGISLPQHAR